MSITDWYSLMPSSVTHEAVLTYDDYGKPATFAAAVTYRARVAYKTRKVTSRVNGEDVISSGSIHVPVIAGLDVNDRITLPDGTTPIILNWDTVFDESGEHHMKIMFR
jgi:hypothetical protein